MVLKNKEKYVVEKIIQCYEFNVLLGKKYVIDNKISRHIFEFVNFEHLQNHFHKDVLTS